MNLYKSNRDLFEGAGSSQENYLGKVTPKISDKAQAVADITYAKRQTLGRSSKPEELQQMLSNTVDEQIYTDERGNKFQQERDASGNIVNVPYTGETRNLYIDNTVTGDMKLGLARSDVEDPFKYRYSKNPQYDGTPGVKGVTVDNGALMSIELPYSTATETEALVHRNNIMVNKRAAGIGKVDKKTKELYGQGYTEYYGKDAPLFNQNAEVIASAPMKGTYVMDEPTPEQAYKYRASQASKYSDQVLGDIETKEKGILESIPNAAKGLMSGIVNTASSVSKAPEKLYDLLGGDYLEKGSDFQKQYPTYSKYVKGTIDAMSQGAKALDKYNAELIGYNPRKGELLQKQIGKAWEEKNYVTGILGALADNPAGAMEMAANMYGFSKAMGAKGLTGVPVIAGAYMDNADQAQAIYEKEYGKKPEGEALANILMLSAAGTAMDTVMSKAIFSKAGGNKLATAVTQQIDNIVAKVPTVVARAALGVAGKTGALMLGEGLQEGFTEATTVLGGTQDLGKAMQDKYQKQVYEAAGIGAVTGPGMKAVNMAENVGGLALEVGKDLNAGVDTFRTRAPKMSEAERREVELAGGVPTSDVGYTKQTNEYTTTFKKAMQSNDMTTAKGSIDEYLQQTQAKLDTGELEEGSPEYIDTKTKLTEMYGDYYKKAQKTVTPEFQAASRDYKRYKEDPTTPPDVLGSSRESLGRNIQDIIDSGTVLDDADTAEMETLAKDLGIDTTQYKAEQEALAPIRELEATATKTMNRVTYESLIGENGVQRVYEKLKAAVKAKDNNAAVGFMRQLENFKNTQVSKVEALQKGLEQYKTEVESNPKAKIEVPYSVDAKKKFIIGVEGKVDTPKYAINAANKVIEEASTTVGMLDKVLQAVKIKTPKEVVQEAKPTEEVQTPKVEEVEPVKQSKVEEVETPTEVAETQVEETKPKEVVKDTSEVKEEPTEAEVKAQAKEARTEVRKKEVVQAKKSALKETLKKLQIKAKGGKWKVEDKAYLQDLGIVVGNTVELNDDVLEAMSIALINWIGTDAESTMKVTDKDIKRMLKVKGDKVTAVQLKMMSGKGIFRKNVVQSLGQAVVNELGLELPEGVAYNVRQSIVTGLGNTLVAYMRDQGMITTNEISADEWNKANKLEGSDKVSKAIPMVQFNYDAIAEIKSAKQMLKEDPELRYKDAKEKGPQYGKATSKKKHEYRNRSGQVSEKDEARLSAQDKIQHNVKDNVYKAFKALGEYGKIAAGWVDVNAIKNKTHTTTRQAIQAVNNSIERSLEHLEDHIENAENKMYSFNYFMSGNGRDMIDSNTFNPQSDKIHRHMDYTGEVTYINTQEESRELELFKIAVLQGLDIKTADKRAVDKMTESEINNAWNELLQDETKLAYVESLSEGKVDPVLAKEISEYAGSKGKIHTIDALVALGDYTKADKSGNPMATTLQLEVDAVTSGWILALLQNPMFDMQTNKEYLAKGGIYLDDMTADYQDRAAAKELDSYETVMEAVQAEMKGKLGEKAQSILKVDRKFAKGPFMTNVTYGAGIDGVKVDIVEQYIQNLYDKMSEGREGLVEVAKALRELGIHLGNIQNPTEYIFDEKTYKAIEKKVNETYGKAVENALSKKYKQFIDVRNTINKAFEEMFKTYSDKYAEGMKALKEKGSITAKELKDLEASLVEFIPTIKSPNGTDVQIYSKEKMENIFPKDYEFQTQFLNAADITTQAEMKRVVAAKAAGGVVPIHFIDGAIIGELLQKFQMTGIYDAGMFNLGDVDSATKMYNETIMKVSKEYNLLEEVIKEASRLGIGTETMQDLKDASKVANTNREIIHSSDLNVQHFAMAGIAYKQESKAKPMSEDKVQDILQDTPNEVVNGIERLKGKVRTEDMNAIMSVIKQFKEC